MEHLDRNPFNFTLEELEALSDAAKVMADAEGDFLPDIRNQEQVQITEEL